MAEFPQTMRFVTCVRLLPARLNASWTASDARCASRKDLFVGVFIDDCHHSISQSCKVMEFYQIRSSSP